MILYRDRDILEDDGTKTVIVQQVPCYGQLVQGLPSRVSKKYDGWYDDYKSYCNWFTPDNAWNNKDYTDQIRGTFHRYPIGENRIICSVFTIEGGKKDIGNSDLQLWEKVIRKIQRQTKYVNQKSNSKWTIHIQSDIGCIRKNDDNEELIDLFKEYFDNSEVNLVIHG